MKSSRKKKMFTGYYDKHGNKLYENDIVLYTEGNCKGYGRVERNRFNTQKLIWFVVIHVITRHIYVKLDRRKENRCELVENEKEIQNYLEKGNIF